MSSGNPPRRLATTGRPIALNACGNDTVASSGDAAPADAADALPPAGNHALSFDGKGDYVTTGTARFPAAGAPQTISLWVRYGAATGTQTIVALRSDFNSGIVVGIRNGTLCVWSVYGSRMLVAAPALPAIGVWHPIAYVFDGTVHTLYVDGVSVATSRAIGTMLTPFSSWLGSIDGLTDFYAGAMDEIRIWSVARSAAEIMTEMEGQVSDVTPGLVAYFDCDQINGTRILDLSGNGNDATLGGGDPTRTPALIESTVPPTP